MTEAGEATQVMANIEAAHQAGLEWVSDTTPGISRRRAGKGFVYRTVAGKRPRERTLQRIRSLAIPPAWKQVWICPDERGHIQATGYDGRGRKQYLYHPDWAAGRSATKYHRMLSFGKALPQLRDAVQRDLKRPGLCRERVIAAAVALLDQTGLRIGNEAYERANRTYGLTTLKAKHGRIEGSRLRLRFVGKGGKKHDLVVKNRKVANVVAACAELPGERLFQYEGSDGSVRSLRSQDINEYVKLAAGKPFSAKDFRTWAASVAAARILCLRPVPRSQREAKRTTNEMLCEVAAALGNTPTVCRKCYVHPLVVEQYAAGALAEIWKQRHKEWERSDGEPAERLFLALLRQEQGKSPADRRVRRTARKRSAMRS